MSLTTATIISNLVEDLNKHPISISQCNSCKRINRTTLEEYASIINKHLSHRFVIEVKDDPVFEECDECTESLKLTFNNRGIQLFNKLNVEGLAYLFLLNIFDKIDVKEEIYCLYVNQTNRTTTYAYYVYPRMAESKKLELFDYFVSKREDESDIRKLIKRFESKTGLDMTIRNYTLVIMCNNYTIDEIYNVCLKSILGFCYLTADGRKELYISNDEIIKNHDDVLVMYQSKHYKLDLAFIFNQKYISLESREPTTYVSYDIQEYNTNQLICLDLITSMQYLYLKSESVRTFASQLPPLKSIYGFYDGPSMLMYIEAAKDHMSLSQLHPYMELELRYCRAKYILESPLLKTQSILDYLDQFKESFTQLIESKIK